MRAIVYVFVALLACSTSFAYDLELLTEEKWNELVENNRKFRSMINPKIALTQDWLICCSCCYRWVWSDLELAGQEGSEESDGAIAMRFPQLWYSPAGTLHQCRSIGSFGPVGCGVSFQLWSLHLPCLVWHSFVAHWFSSYASVSMDWRPWKSRS